MSSAMQLENAINLKDLLEGNGSTFKFSKQTQSDALFNIVEDDDNDDDSELENEVDATKPNPTDDIIVEDFIGQSFSSIRQRMQPIGYDIYKQVLQEAKEDGPLVTNTSRVNVQFSAFVEGEVTPFDSTFFSRKRVLLTMGQDMLPGLQFALLSMKAGETSQFIIPYNLVYGEVGLETAGVPKRADAFYIVRLISFEDIGDSNAIDDEYLDLCDDYRNVKERVEVVRQSGRTHFKAGNYLQAKKDFHKCIKALRTSTNADEEERNVLYGQLYVNMAICYNKLERPAKVLDVLGDLKEIGLFEQNCKAVFQYGRALARKGDFEEALAYLAKAQKLEPNNREIAAELRGVNQDLLCYREAEKKIATLAIRGDKKGQAHGKEDNPMLAENHPIHKIIRNFAASDSLTKYALPIEMSVNQLNQIHQVAQLYDLGHESLQIGNEMRHFLLKNPNQSS